MAGPDSLKWSRRQDSNLQQAVYKTATLPLRHAGARIAPEQYTRNSMILKKKMDPISHPAG